MGSSLLSPSFSAISLLLQLLSAINNGKSFVYPHLQSSGGRAACLGRHTPSKLQMIIPTFDGDKSVLSTAVRDGLPRDVKDAVSRCRVAVQKALKNRLSRMDIEFPVGTRFGVEKAVPRRQAELSSGQLGATPTPDLLNSSDRELARLFVEMFQPVGGDNIAVVFQDERLADLAKRQWKVDAGACRVFALDRRKDSKKAKKKSLGFAAKMMAETESGEDGGAARGLFQLPSNMEVAIFVAPGPKELVIVEQICAKVGMATLTVLLNARLSKITNYGTIEAQKLFQQQFESVFCLSAAPQNEAPGCLLYRAYPHPWVLARKPKVGQPKPILATSQRPSSNECRTAYKTLEISEMERNVETLLENIAGWFQ